MQRLRSALGQPSVRWSGPCLLAALQLAVKVRSWPSHAARQALLLVAADAKTCSPMRLAEAGPWWDRAVRQTLQRTPQEQAELDGLERLLADCDDRAVLQQQARRQLAHDGQAITRLSVARRAARLLENETRDAPQPPDSQLGQLGSSDVLDAAIGKMTAAGCGQPSNVIQRALDGPVHRKAHREGWRTPGWERLN